MSTLEFKSEMLSLNNQLFNFGALLKLLWIKFYRLKIVNNDTCGL